MNGRLRRPESYCCCGTGTGVSAFSTGSLSHQMRPIASSSDHPFFPPSPLQKGKLSGAYAGCFPLTRPLPCSVSWETGHDPYTRQAAAYLCRWLQLGQWGALAGGGWEGERSRDLCWTLPALPSLPGRAPSFHNHHGGGTLAPSGLVGQV